jgi:hypothetical protein
MTGKKMPDDKPENKPEKKPEKPPEGKKPEKNTRLAIALLIIAVLLLAFTLPIIIDALFIYAGYEDPSPLLIMLGEMPITAFNALLTIFIIILAVMLGILLRDMVQAYNDDREKKKPGTEIKKPKKDLELYEEKPENRRSFGS